MNLVFKPIKKISPVFSLNLPISTPVVLKGGNTVIAKFMLFFFVCFFKIPIHNLSPGRGLSVGSLNPPTSWLL